MSKFIVSKMKCNICGRENEVTTLAMASQQGTYDLDFRPPETKRSSMPLWIKKCDYCRNVFSTSLPMPDCDEKFINSQSFVNCGGIAGLPDLGKNFVKLALVFLHCGEYLNAGDHFLYAAWCCDDEGLDVTASVCRQKALEAYNEVNARTMTKRELLEMELRIVDMLRRCGMFEETIGFLNSIEVEDEKGQAICAFQAKKAAAKDKKCYRMEHIDQK